MGYIQPRNTFKYSSLSFYIKEKDKYLLKLINEFGFKITNNDTELISHNSDYNFNYYIKFSNDKIQLFVENIQSEDSNFIKDIYNFIYTDRKNKFNRLSGMVEYMFNECNFRTKDDFVYDGPDQLYEKEGLYEIFDVIIEDYTLYDMNPQFVFMEFNDQRINTPKIFNEQRQINPLGLRLIFNDNIPKDDIDVIKYRLDELDFDIHYEYLGELTQITIIYDKFKTIKQISDYFKEKELI